MEYGSPDSNAVTLKPARHLFLLMESLHWQGVRGWCMWWTSPLPEFRTAGTCDHRQPSSNEDCRRGRLSTPTSGLDSLPSSSRHTSVAHYFLSLWKIKARKKTWFGCFGDVDSPLQVHDTIGRFCGWGVNTVFLQETPSRASSRGGSTFNKKRFLLMIIDGQSAEVMINREGSIISATLSLLVTVSVWCRMNYSDGDSVRFMSRLVCFLVGLWFMLLIDHTDW